MSAPFVAYADYESILRSIQDKNKTQEHVACSYGYQIVSKIPGLEFETRHYIGLDATEHFLDSLQKDLDTHIMPLIENDVSMIWDEPAKLIFEKSTQCCICEEDFQDLELHCHNQFDTKINCKICIENEKKIPVRDHCHFTVISNTKLRKVSINFLFFSTI